MTLGRISALVLAHIVVVVVAGAGAGGPARAAASEDLAPAVSEIDSCVRRLDPQLDIGYDRIAARCPSW